MIPNTPRTINTDITHTCFLCETTFFEGQFHECEEFNRTVTHSFQGADETVTIHFSMSGHPLIYISSYTFNGPRLFDVDETEDLWKQQAFDEFIDRETVFDWDEACEEKLSPSPDDPIGTTYELYERRIRKGWDGYRTSVSYPLYVTYVARLESITDSGPNYSFHIYIHSNEFQADYISNE